MKRFLIMIVLVLFLSACTADEKEKIKNFDNDNTTQSEFQQEKDNEKEEKIKGVWLSCFELPNAQQGEKEFKENIDIIFDNIKKLGCNTAFIHVRPFADSIYPSQIFPWSKYCCDSKDPGFDPLKIIIDSSKQRGIAVHAWINPFRISSGDDLSKIPKSSPALNMMGKNKSDVVILPSGIYFNPSSPNVHSLIYSGVEEILKNYDVAGIHIDDYFYPASQEDIDEKEFNEYKNSGGTLSLSEWRKNSISAFVSGLYSITQSYGKLLSISPAGNLKYNEEKMYADIPLWLSEKGYADIIIPQLYYGFEHDKFPFEKAAQDWANLKTSPDVKLLAGLASYKCKKQDKNAGKAGENEWINDSKIIERQILFLKNSKNYSGEVFFSYSYIF